MSKPNEDDGRHPDVIWLQPWCLKCEERTCGDGRVWCQNNVWEPCEECWNQPVKYRIVDLSE